MADPGMLSQVLGLVSQGMSPQEAQKSLEQAQLMELAKMTPAQQTYLGTAMAGNRLASGLGRLFGGGAEQDAVLNRASEFAALRNETDPTDPESLMKLSKTLSEKGFAAQADVYAKMARELLKEQSDIKLKGAQTYKELAQGQEVYDKRAALNSRTNMLIEAGMKESEARGIASNDTAFSKYVENKNIPTPPDYAVQAVKLGFGSKAKLSDYTPEQMAQMEKGVFSHKAGIAQAGASINKPVDVASIIKEIGTRKDIEGKSEAWKAAGDAYKMQVPMIEKLKEVRNNLPTTFTGAFADTALQFGKGLSALGIPVDEKKLSDTEYMNGISAQVLQTIARNFPGSLAVKEMEQLVKSKFNSSQQVKTISRVLSDLQTEIEAGTKSYEQLAKLPETARYSKDLNLLTGQNYNKLKRYRSLEDKGREALKTGKPMTKDEVEEAQKLQKELGV